MWKLPNSSFEKKKNQFIIFPIPSDFCTSKFQLIISSGCITEENIDYRGNDIHGGRTKVENQDACARLSFSKRGSSFWTYQPLYNQVMFFYGSRGIFALEIRMVCLEIRCTTSRGVRRNYVSRGRKSNWTNVSRGNQNHTIFYVSRGGAIKQYQHLSRN